jgi:hypothetical protein
MYGKFLTILFIVFAFTSVAFAADVFTPRQGGTGIGTATVGDITKCLKVLNNSPFAYELGACGGGGGNSKFATSTNGTDIQPNAGQGLNVSASSTFSSALNVGGVLNASSSALFQSLISYASSTFQNLTGRNATTSQATTTNFHVSSLFNFGGDVFSDLVGTGLQVVNGVLETTLGTSIDISSETNLTAGDGLTLTGDDLDCDTASASLFGCLLSADWSLFNTKISSSSLSGASVISYTPSTGVITTTGGTFGSGNYIFPAQLQVNSSTTLQNFTGMNATTTNATTTNFRVSGNTILSSLTDALLITGSNGFVSEYTGTTCTNQFVRALSALGVATCETVQNTDLANSSLTVNGTVISLGGSGTIAAASSTLLADNNTFMGKNVFGGLLSASSTSLFQNIISYASSTLQRFTATHGTTTNATSTTFAISNLTSALIVTGADGSAGEYAGTTCTNQFIRSLSSLGIATCATVANTDLANSSVTVNGTSISLGSSGTITAASSTLLADNNTFSGTNLFSSIFKASSTALFTNGFTAYASSTLQNFIGVNATTSNATSTTLAVSDNLKIGTLSGLLKAVSGRVEAAISGTDYEVPITFGDGLTRTANDADCDTASSAVFGCLLSADWTLFNTKISSSSLSGASVISYTPATGVITTTGGTFGTGAYIFPSTLQVNSSTTLQAFTATNATTTNATSTNFTVSGNTFLSSLTSALLITGANGLAAEYTGTSCTNQFVRSLSTLGVATCATVANTDLTNSSLTVNGTSISLGGSGTITAASSTLLANNNTFSGSNVFSGLFSASSTSLFQNLITYASSTLQNFTATRSTTTAATTTSFAITGTATSTFAGGVSLSAGCFAVGSTCIESGIVGAIGRRRFTANDTYVPRANLIYAVIECVGGGGGGGAANGVATFVLGGGGGGAGGYSRTATTSAVIGASQVVTIGTVGSAGATPGGNGGAGGQTSVGTLCVANGGGGGDGATTGNVPSGGTAGAIGNGDIASPGSRGRPGINTSTVAVDLPAGDGGDSQFGSGGSGAAAGGGATGTGSAGLGFGAGGGGGSANDTASDGAGAAGLAGVVIITEYATR